MTTQKFFQIFDHPQSFVVCERHFSFAVRSMAIRHDVREDQVSFQPCSPGACEYCPTTEPFDTVGFVMAFEAGELGDEEIIKGFQHLLDSGLVWKLQGFYGRTAQNLLNQGLITRR